MKRSAFILIPAIYGIIIGFVFLFLPKTATEYFGRNPDDLHLLSIFKFFGLLQIAYNLVGFSIRKSENMQLVKTYLLSLILVLFGSVFLSVTDVFFYGIVPHKTFYIDLAVWAILGVGSIYFYIKEK